MRKIQFHVIIINVDKFNEDILQKIGEDTFSLFKIYYARLTQIIFAWLIEATKMIIFL